MSEHPLLSIQHASILHQQQIFLRDFSWTVLPGEAWVITGSNGSGKTTLINAIIDSEKMVPSSADGFFSAFSKITLLSFEAVAAFIENELKNDDSDFVEGGIDPGRTPATLLQGCPEAERFASICGISHILHRGLKFLSTGEIRRTLLAQALAGAPDLLILDDPFDGLDSEGVATLSALLDSLIGSASSGNKTAYMIVLDRYISVPRSCTHVLELEGGKTVFSGTREDFEQLLAERTLLGACEPQNASLPADLDEELAVLDTEKTLSDDTKPLIEMTRVSVEWSGRKVLEDVSWTVNKGEHWIIRGPNGSGKTTLLELITGDNPQVFKNRVSLFGAPRGSGETIWEIKEKIGFVSHRLHQEYRRVGDVTVETVIVSGFYDSIGLYERASTEEREKAARWLELGNLQNLAKEAFNALSYGDQRSLLILRAAVKLPPLIILDEPCHGLDEQHRARTLSLMQRIAETGHSTLLHVTHDPDEYLPCETNILELLPGGDPMYRIITR